MRPHPRSYLLPVVAVAGLALAAGCSSAPTRRPAHGGAATASTSTASTSTASTSTASTSTAGGTTSAAALTAGGNVHLTDYTDDDGPTSTVILAGAVGDYGKAESVNPDGSPTRNTAANSP
ncbi:hypothetical protein GCM10023322_44650 [Rugosimonospora acidiphila]|uniref:Uncharacterized protein n=1 Tax=Rugosimonospora acidiphila TaxID=556531 RepID=A0ABP9S189_9ACTN